MAEHLDTQTLPHPDVPELQKTNIGVPKDLWLEVRTSALNIGIDAQDIYVEGARLYLAAYRERRRDKMQSAVRAIADAAIAKNADRSNV